MIIEERNYYYRANTSPINVNRSQKQLALVIRSRTGVCDRMGYIG